MKKPVVLRARADADIDSALEHYLVEAPDLIDDLLKAFESTLTSIGRTPTLGSPLYGHALELPGLRYRLTKRFPYLVFYLEGPKDISVLRVLHQHRDVPAAFEPE